MKKLSVIMAAAVLAVSLFTGCGNKKASDSISIMFQG